MGAPELSELSIEISGADATDEDVDRMMRQLLSELREMNVESADLVRSGTAPAGTKAVDPVTIGTIAVTVLPSLLPKVVEAVQAWALRGSNRAVRFKGRVGRQAIEFEGSAEDLQRVLTQLSKGERKR